MSLDTIKILSGLAGLLILLSLSSCATPSPKTTVITQGAQIKLPESPPKRVAICLPNMEHPKDTVCLSEPTRIPPNTQWTAPANGAWVWQHQDLQGIYYALVEYPRYIDVLHGIIGDHNRRMGGEDDKGLMGKLKWWK